MIQAFFTSDTHFDDPYSIPYFNRPFKGIDEMNRVMVENWSSIVAENDTVYHLGDFTLDDIGHFTKWASKLNGRTDRVRTSYRGQMRMLYAGSKGTGYDRNH